MYVIVEINGQQFKAEQGKKLFVHHIQNAESGAVVEFDKVLLVDNNGEVTVGVPTVEGAKVVSSLQMKKSGRINAMVIAEEEMKKCKDTAGFIAFIYWREALFGGIVAIVGLVGIINELTNFLGKLTLAELVIFLGSFLWFQNSLKTAREKFLHI